MKSQIASYFLLIMTSIIFVGCERQSRIASPYTHLEMKNIGLHVWSYMEVSEGDKWDAAKGGFIKQIVTGDCVFAFKSGSVLELKGRILTFDGAVVPLGMLNCLIDGNRLERGAFIRTFD